MTTRGKFILFEGLDRSGKTTQSTRLVDHLNKAGKHTVLIKFPNRETPIGKMIDSYLTNKTDVNDRMIHLMFTMNRWEEMTAFHQYIHAGVNVVMDRFSYSGVAYSAAKKTLLFEWCIQAEEGLPKPDIVLFMDMPNTSLRPGWGRNGTNGRSSNKKFEPCSSALKNWNRPGGSTWMQTRVGKRWNNKFVTL